jgi:putative cell wall-binding protein
MTSMKPLALLAGFALAAGLLGAAPAPPPEQPPAPTAPAEVDAPQREAELAEPLLENVNTYSFRAGDIISDKAMYNGAAMDAGAVQAFLDSQVETCGNSLCLRRFGMATPTLAADAYCKAYAGSSRDSAAAIIAKAGTACGVSQKALLALLQKESQLVTAAAPTQGALDAATGYDCRDDGTPCDPATSGFFNQIHNAARQLKSDFQNPRLPIGTPTTVLYHPDAARCGSAPLTIRTKATAALYSYTPYQPNAAALEFGNPGDACSSYGNLNFWVVYTDWFGYPHIDTDRLEGATRYDVAVAIAREAYPAGATTLFLANGTGYADALSAGPAAVRAQAPLLLTEASALPPVVREAVRGMTSVTRIVVVGGPNSVSEAVLSELRKLRPVAKVERWSGADRFEVSRRVALEAFPNGAEGAYLATGTNFPDALSASGAGGSLGRPVVLVDGSATTVDRATATLLQTLKTSTVTIAGGPNSVSSGWEASLRRPLPNGKVLTVRRLAGADRYAASLAINLDAYAADRPGGQPRDRVFVATGQNFPDALAGSALAGAKGSPPVVVPQNCVPQEFRLSLQRFQAVRVTLLGGPNSLGAGVQSLTSCG